HQHHRVTREQVPEQLLVRRLVQVLDRLGGYGGVGDGRFDHLARDRQQAIDNDTLLHDRLEFVVHQVDGVHFAVGERLDRGRGDFARVVEIEAAKEVDLLVADLEAAAGVVVAAAAPYQAERDLARRVLG